MKIMLVALIALFTHLNTSDLTAAVTQSSLRVIVQSMRGSGIAGLSINVYSASDASLLAQAFTDSQGQALFTALPPTDIRIKVAGQLPDGTVLRQQGSDTQGLWFALSAGKQALSFIVTSAGFVELNPDGLLDAYQELPAEQQTSIPTAAQGMDCGAGSFAACGPAESIALERSGTGAQFSYGRSVSIIALVLIMVVLVFVMRGGRI